MRRGFMATCKLDYDTNFDSLFGDLRGDAYVPPVLLPGQKFVDDMIVEDGQLE